MSDIVTREQNDMNRRQLFPTAAATLICTAVPYSGLFAGPLSCADDPPRRISCIPYNIHVPLQDEPDLFVETWKHRDKTIVFCRWPEMSAKEVSEKITELFRLGYGK